MLQSVRDDFKSRLEDIDKYYSESLEEITN